MSGMAGRAQLAEKLPEPPALQSWLGGWRVSFLCAAGPGGFSQAVANNGKLAFFWKDLERPYKMTPTATFL